MGEPEEELWKIAIPVKPQSGSNQRVLNSRCLHLQALPIWPTFSPKNLHIY